MSGPLRALATSAEQRGSLEEAKVLSSRVRGLSQSQEDVHAESSSCHLLGVVAVKLEDDALASECFSRSLAIDEQTGNSERANSNRRWLEWLAAKGA